MQIDFDERLAASTVIVDGREWCQGTLTNLALNPSFEAAGSTVEVARNRIPNPRAVSAGSYPVDDGQWHCDVGNRVRSNGRFAGHFPSPRRYSVHGWMVWSSHRTGFIRGNADASAVSADLARMHCAARS